MWRESRLCLTGWVPPSLPGNGLPQHLFSWPFCLFPPSGVSRAAVPARRPVHTRRHPVRAWPRAAPRPVLLPWAQAAPAAGRGPVPVHPQPRGTALQGRATSPGPLQPLLAHAKPCGTQADLEAAGAGEWARVCLGGRATRSFPGALISVGQLPGGESRYERPLCEIQCMEQQAGTHATSVSFRDSVPIPSACCREAQQGDRPEGPGAREGRGPSDKSAAGGRRGGVCTCVLSASLWLHRKPL